jgi:histone H3/H4
MKWNHTLRVGSTRFSNVRIHDILQLDMYKGYYVITAIGSPVLKVISKIRKRRMTQNIPKVTNKRICKFRLNRRTSRQRSNKLNKMFHLHSESVTEETYDVSAVIVISALGF